MVPTKAISPDLRKIFGNQNFLLHEMRNKTLAAVLPDCTQFMPLGFHCNCSTALGIAFVDEPSDAKSNFYDEIPKLRSKGWSKSRIDRWLAEKERASDRPKRADRKEVQDELSRWLAFAGELFAQTETAHLSVIHHAYSGPIDDEKIQITELSAVRFEQLPKETFANMEANHVYQLLAPRTSRTTRASNK